MPQLVIADYAPQLVWLFIAFIALYLILSRLALPGIARALSNRESQIKRDIEGAERLKTEAEAALAAYQTAMTEARAKAQAELKQAASEMASEASRREASFTADANAKTKAAEAAIAAAKTAALADIRRMASTAASQLVARLGGGEPGAAEISAAIDAAERERR